MLRPSTPDEIVLAHEVKVRMLDLQPAYLSRNGRALLPPQDLAIDYRRFVAMCERHSNGDLRNSEDEYKALKAIAQWTIDVNCELRGQPSTTVLWKD